MKGLYTALVTPFKNDKLDEKGLKTLLQRQKEAKVDGVLLLGTTGESPTLSTVEKKQILKIARKELKDLQMIVGVGSASTQMTIEMAKVAEDFGADVLLVVTPYYNKPMQEGIYRHYEAIAKSTTLPIIVYSIMARCAINVEVETMKKLAKIPNVVGVKESSKNLAQIEEIISEVKKVKKDFAVLSGDDSLTLPIMALGGDGIISTASNLVPRKMRELVTALEEMDYTTARKLHFELTPLFRAIFVETNPIPVKAALTKLGLPAGSPRLPLTPLSLDSQKKLFPVLKRYQ